MLTLLLGLLCLGYASPVQATTAELYKPSDKFMTDVVSFIKGQVQELPSNMKYVMVYDVLQKRYYLYFSLKGEELHTYRYLYASSRQTFLKIRGKNAVRIYADENQNITHTEFMANLDENLQNEDFTNWIYNTGSLGSGLSFNKKFLLLEEKFNDGGMTNADKGFMSGLFQGLINALLSPLMLIKNAVDSVMGAVNSIGSMITNAVISIGSAITGAITSMTNAITGALTALGNFIIDGLKSLFIPSQSDLMELLDKFRNWFVLKFGALGQVLVFLTQFVGSLTSGARTFVIDLPPISLFGIQIINLDYDISEVTRTYKVLYDSYYMFVSAGMIFSFMGYLTTQMDTLFND